MKTHTKLFAGFNASVLVGAALVLLAGTAPASAHTPNVVATCDSVTVTLKSYGAAANNTVKVTIDGKSVEDVKFGSKFVKAYPFTDRTKSHTYSVKVDAPGTAYDVTESGESKPCPAPVPPVVVPDKPKPIEDVKDVEKLDCDSKTVTTITTTVTTGWELDKKTNTWIKTKPVTKVTEKVREATPAECTVVTPPTTPPTPVAPPVDPPVETTPPIDPPASITPPVDPPTSVTPPVTPPASVTPPVTPPTSSTVTPVVETAPVADKLPSTGSNMVWTLPLAGGLLLAGIALMLVRRTRRA